MTVTERQTLKAAVGLSFLSKISVNELCNPTVNTEMFRLTLFSVHQQYKVKRSVQSHINTD